MGHKAHLQTAFLSSAILAIYLLIPNLIALTALTAAAAMNAPVSQFGEAVLTVGGNAAAVWLIARMFFRGGVSFAKAVNGRVNGLRPQLGVWLLLAGTGLGLAMSALLSMLPLPPGLMAEYAASIGRFVDGPARQWGLLIAVGFSPLFEEIVFRGFMLTTLRRAFSAKAAVLFTSLIFAVMHGQAVWMTYAFFMGLLLGWAAVRFDTLLAGLFLHYGFNLSALVLGFFSGQGNWPLLGLLAGGGLLAAAGIWQARGFFDDKKEETHDTGGTA